MAKPTEDLGWAEEGLASQILEPTAGQRASGITENNTWTRRRLNWMFRAAGRLSDWVKTYAMDSSENLNDLENKTTSRTNLEVLKAGTGGGEARTNSQNATEFVSHSEVVNNLTSDSETNPLSANQGRELKELTDNALVEGVSDSQGRTNTQNDSRFLIGSNNLSDLTSNIDAQGNLGIITGSLNMDENTTVTVALGRTVVGAVASWGQTLDNASSCGVSWSGTDIQLRNSNGSGFHIVNYIAIVV
jgi:hypothetical protein